VEDHEIISLYWDRDETAIQETDYKYGRFCYSIAINILSVSEDAEECVSDTYHRAWNAIPPEKPTAFRAWLGRIVRNLSINRWHHNRAQKRYAGAEALLSELSDCIPDTESTEKILEAQALSQYISDWLDTLSNTERLLFVRRYWNCEELKQLAASSGTTPNKLAGRMFRLRKSLGTYLAEKGVTI
jgi:RNA polymerase sigma-70 factor (ECF subfamily)